MEAVQVVERFLTAYFRQDAPGVLAVIADDFEWISVCRPDVTTRGGEAMRAHVEEENFGFAQPFNGVHRPTFHAPTGGGLVMYERVDCCAWRGGEIEVPIEAPPRPE